jgi:hypothetical protein
MIDGVGSAPFSAVTIPPIETPPVSHREAIIASSREQFTTPRAGIENAILEELAASVAAPAPLDARMKRRPAASEWPKKPAATVSPAPRREVDRTEERAVPRVAAPSVQREDSRPTPVRAETAPRQSVPNPRPATMPVMKSPGELKAILHTMTTKTTVERERKQTDNKQLLKGALADVLERSRQTAPDVQKAGDTKPEMPRPAAAEPPRSVPTASVGKEKKPFEVPEDALRKILRGET